MNRRTVLCRFAPLTMLAMLATLAALPVVSLAQAKTKPRAKPVTVTLVRWPYT